MSPRGPRELPGQLSLFPDQEMPRPGQRDTRGRQTATTKRQRDVLGQVQRNGDEGAQEDEVARALGLQVLDVRRDLDRLFNAGLLIRKAVGWSGKFRWVGRR